MIFLRALGIILGLACSGFARADEIADSSQTDYEKNFNAGQSEVAAGGQVLFSPFIATGGRPTVNYGGGLIQYGYMLNDLKESGSLRGNFEVLGELAGSSIFVGDGTYVASATFWLRYNLVLSGWRFIPFVQIGGGISLTDADHDVFGQTFNFNLDVAPGVRYFVTPHCSLNAEYRYQHISNANIAKHNLGINAQGVALSVSWYF